VGVALSTRLLLLRREYPSNAAAFMHHSISGPIMVTSTETNAGSKEDLHTDLFLS
jgi:hypothetical protein